MGHPDILYRSSIKNPSEVYLSLSFDLGSVRLRVAGFHDVPISHKLAEKHQFLSHVGLRAVGSKTLNHMSTVRLSWFSDHLPNIPLQRIEEAAT